MEVDSYWGGVLLVLGSGLVAVLGLLLTRKVLSLDKLRECHDVGGYLLSVVGTLYAVLIGLIVVDAMQKFQMARDVTEHEANALADVYILAKCMPEPKRSEVRSLCVQYANQVVNSEWDKMDHGAYCPVARSMVIGLSQSLVDFEPVTENQKALYPIIITDASQVWQNRRTRTNMAMHSLPMVEWITIIVGGVITVFFTFFFGLEHVKLQVAMTAMVAMLISLNIYLILLFGYPFSGDLRIPTDSFRLNQGIFGDQLTNINHIR